MSTFADDWGFPSEVMKSIPGACSYDINPYPGTFKSGRQKYEVTFISSAGDKRRVVDTRLAMQLLSKKTGRPYTVCKRRDSLPPHGQAASDAIAMTTAANSQFGLNDLYLA
jgi:hypothetical protein